MLLIDPWALTCPPDLTQEDVDDYVGLLAQLHELAEKHPGVLHISSAAVELLEASGRYPLSNEFPEILWPYKPDLVRLLVYLLDRLPKVEDLPVQEVLLSKALFSPPLGAEGRRLEHLAELGARLLILAMLRRGDGAILTQSDIASSRHQLALELGDVECEEGIEVGCSTYDGELRFAFDREGFFEIVDNAWVASHISLEFAIAIEIWRRGGQELCPMSESRLWGVGSELAASVTRCNIGSNPARMRATLRSCADAILRIDQRDTHVLREGKGPKSAQRRRKQDGAGAWRRDIDREFHLHYWISGPNLELANVVFHNESDIAE